MKDEHVNDISNYQKLYMQYAPMLLRFAGKFISPFFAEDIVHDVFLRIWDKQVFLLSESEVKNILFVAETETPLLFFTDNRIHHR